MTAAIGTQGVQIQASDMQPTPVFTTIAKITSFTGPTETAPEIDVSSLDSTSAEFIAGLRDGGTVSLELNLVPTNAEQLQLRNDMNTRTVRDYKIILTDSASTEITFSANVLEFGITGTVNDKVAASASLKITGDVTYT